MRRPLNVQAEISRQMNIRAAVMTTTNTPGWNYIKEIADKVVEKNIQEALDEDNPVSGEAKRLKAKALQKGFADLWATLDTIKQYDPEAVNTDDNGLGNLEHSDVADELEAIANS